MKKSILKSVAIALVLLLVGGVVFADMSAKVTMKGNLWSSDDALTLADADWRYGDEFLNFSFSGEKAGASFALATAGIEGDADAHVYALKAAAWFKPADMLKISMGDVTAGALYTEQLNWWHKASGLASQGTADYQNWNDNAAGKHENKGFTAEVLGVENLTLIFAVGTDAYGTVLSDGYEGYSLGFLAKYGLSFGSAGAAFSYNGDDADDMVIRVGADINTVANLYAFEQVIVTMNGAQDGLTGVAFETYVKYSMSDLTLHLHAPVTLRLLDTEDSYMSYDFKAQYGMGALAPYLHVRQFGAVLEGFTFDPQLRLGTTYNVGDGGNLEVTLEINNVATDTAVTYAIPFKYTVSF